MMQSTPRSMTRRRLLATLVAGAVGVTGLAACSGGGATAPAGNATAAPANGPTAAAGASAAPTTAPAAQAAAPSGAKASLAQWYHQYGEKGTQQAVMKYAQDYEAATPGVTVTVTWVPGDYSSKLSTALAGGSGPDVFEISPNPTVAMVKANQVAPLDDLLTADVKNDFNPKDLLAGTISGKVYSIKMIDDTAALYYRTSVLKTAGIDPPKTFDDLMAAAKKLTTRQQKGLFIGNDGGIGELLTLLPASAGSDILGSDGKIAFNNDKTVAAYESLAKLNKDGGLLIGSPTDWTDPSAFIQGLCAMQWEGLWAYPAINDALKDDFDVMPWPPLPASGGQGSPTTLWTGWAELASAQSKNLDAAKALIKWLWIDNAKVQTDWSSAYGFHVPPRISVAKADDKLKSGRPLAFVQNMYTDGQTLGPTWDAAMSTIVLTALSNVVKFGKSAKDEVALAAAKCQTELDTELK